MKDLTDEMKNYVQYGAEERRWEFKPPMAWSTSQKKKKFEIAKAIFALSNITDGGFIVVGIFQKRDRSRGIVFERKGLLKRQFNTFNNEDDIGRFLNEKTNQEVKIEIYGGLVQVDGQDKRFAVIRVYESQQVLPVICLFDFKSRERRCRLEKGDLYIRSTSNPVESRKIKSNEEWEELILRLLSRKEKILYTDLEVICGSMTKSKAKKEVSKKSTKPRLPKEYDKLLKRDKL